MEKIDVVLITQARTGSTRLPGKVLLKVNDQELLKIHLTRLSRSKLVDKVIVATTVNETDEVILKLCEEWGFTTFRGSEDDVLDRFYSASREIKPKWIVRVTSDCPLIDPELIDAVIALASVNDVDYCSNGIIENFPDGQDVEVFKFTALETAWKDAKLKSDREHVTPYIRNHSSINGGDQFNVVNFPCAYNFAKVRMTVDEPRDFSLIEKLIIDLGIAETWLTYTNYILTNGLDQMNNEIIRNEGFLKSLKNDK